MKAENGTLYKIINILVFAAGLVIFLMSYGIWQIFTGSGQENGGIAQLFDRPGLSPGRCILLLVPAVVLVHFIKGLRLYLAVYGLNISKFMHTELYLRVTPISVILPFKLGEFFRMYCYGAELGSMLKGIVIILLDRFMDTAALVTVLLLFCLQSGGLLSGVAYVLIIFLVFMISAYFVFPGLHSFWKKYLLQAAATENKLRMLKLLEAVEAVYREITLVTRGRGALLYFLSLLAWGAEIGSFAIVYGKGEENIGGSISEYLSGALGGSMSEELSRFVFISVVVLLALKLLTGLYSQARKNCEMKK